MPTTYAAALRRELCLRNAKYATRLGLLYRESYGELPAVVYQPFASRHGNFLDSAYRSILKRPEWKRRLDKVHSQARRSLPPSEHGWKELDSCVSSDALLMNVFCCAGVLQNRNLATKLGYEVGDFPAFGFRAHIPRHNGHADRTEIDMKLGSLLAESKLTETDFQNQRPALVESYRDFDEVFEPELLPKLNGQCASYQLIRNVLAAHHLGLSFCVLLDARRPDLLEAWFAVMRCVRIPELRTRCKVLTWQELAESVPDELQDFLDQKYGIVPAGRTSSMSTTDGDD